jgi:hypothetical protein
MTESLGGFHSRAKELRYDQETPVYFHSRKDKSKRYIYIQTSPNSKVLAVGHTDYVVFQEPKVTYNTSKIHCGQLDDRLGVWLISEVIPKMINPDQPFDILLTDLEEKGDSTAQHFVPPKDKQYNWMFEFDRRGTDMVMYDYETPELKKLWQSYKFTVGMGSFTDICYLSHLHCAGFNIGTGYHGEHSQNCYADLFDTFRNVEKFLRFYTEQYDNHLEHNHKAAEKKHSGRVNWKSGWSSQTSTNKGTIGFHNNPHYATGSSGSRHGNTYEGYGPRKGLDTSSITGKKDDKKGKDSKPNPFEEFELGTDVAANALREAMKDVEKRNKIIAILSKAMATYTDEDWVLYKKYIVPLKRREGSPIKLDIVKDKGLKKAIPKTKPRANLLSVRDSEVATQLDIITHPKSDKLFITDDEGDKWISDELVQDIKAKRELVDKGQWTDAQMSHYISSKIKEIDCSGYELLDENGHAINPSLAPTPITVPDKQKALEDAHAANPDLSIDEYDHLFHLFALDTEALDMGLSFKEWLEDREMEHYYEHFGHIHSSAAEALEHQRMYDPDDDYYKKILPPLKEPPKTVPWDELTEEQWKEQKALLDKHGTMDFGAANSGDLDGDDTVALLDDAEDKSGSLDELEPTDSELEKIENYTKEEIQNEVMSDPLYSSEYFPGGNRSRAEFLQTTKGLT